MRRGENCLGEENSLGPSLITCEKVSFPESVGWGRKKRLREWGEGEATVIVEKLCPATSKLREGKERKPDAAEGKKERKRT